VHESTVQTTRTAPSISVHVYARIKVLTQLMYSDMHAQLYCSANHSLRPVARLYVLMNARCISTQYGEILMLGISNVQLFGEIGA
jgi:hypothetical protein